MFPSIALPTKVPSMYCQRNEVSAVVSYTVEGKDAKPL